MYFAKYVMKRHISRKSEYQGKESFSSKEKNAFWQCLMGKKQFEEGLRALG